MECLQLAFGMALCITIFMCVLVWLALALSLAFMAHRLAGIRDLIALIWNHRRRQILFLNCLNGFDEFRDQLHHWSFYLAIAAAISVFPVFLWQPDSLGFACVLVCLTFALRSLVRSHVAGVLAGRACLPLDYDGFGSYARSEVKWRRESRDCLRHTRRAAGVALIYAVLTLGGWI